MNAVEPLKLNPWSSVADYLPEGFLLNTDGLFLDRANTPTRISGPCWISALTRTAKGDGWGIVVNWIDRDGHPKQKAFPAQRLTERGAALADDLQALGLQVIPGEQRHLMRYLGSYQLPNSLRLLSTTKLGWLDTADGDLVYVLPERVFNTTGANGIIFQPEAHDPTAHTLRCRGTLEQWRNNVAKPCQESPLLIFNLSAALSGPLLKLAGLDSGGFHLFGASSKGKTTALQVAASVWGCGADPAASGDSFIGRWNTTGNALEAVAAAHNDGLLALDEMGTCDAKNFGKIIYDLLGGKGKSRMAKTIQLREQRDWRITALSTGEISTHQKIQQDSGKAPLTGQLIRMLDIPIHEGALVGRPGDDLAAFANRLKQACSQYYGTAASRFIDKLIALAPHAPELALRIQERIKQQEVSIPGNIKLESFQQRVLTRLAVVAVAGTLAVEFGILPFTAAQITDAVKSVWHAWLGDMDNQPDAIQGLRALRSFLLRHHSRFRHIQKSDNFGVVVHDVAGYRDPERDLYLFTDDGFREACGGHDWRGVLDELGARGRLFMNNGSRKKSKHTVAGVGDRLTLYAVGAAIIDDEI